MQPEGICSFGKGREVAACSNAPEQFAAKAIAATVKKMIETENYGLL